MAQAPPKTKQYRRWCFTLKADNHSSDDVIKALKELGGGKYAFQKEQGAGGLIHYQGRVSFKQGKRLVELKRGILQPAHWGIEAAEEASTFYALKEDTRAEGPWTDKDVVPYIPRRLRVGEDGLRQWQRWILTRVRQQDDRKITFLVDREGNSGKSFLGLWIATHGGVRLPSSLTSVQDIIQAAMATLGDNPGKTRVVVLDVPRSVSGDEKWFKFCAALEDIKNGHICDPRYSYRQAFIEPPQILVFGNAYPPKQCLSGDRFDCVDILWARFACGELSRSEYDERRAAERAAREKQRARVSADIEQESEEEEDEADVDE